MPVDASCGFYHLKSSLSLSCIEPVSFIKCVKIRFGATSYLLQVVETSIKLGGKSLDNQLASSLLKACRRLVIITNFSMKGFCLQPRFFQVYFVFFINRFMWVMCLLKSMMNVFPDYLQRKVKSWRWYYYLILVGIILIYYCKWCSLIGYSTCYLFIIR